MPETARRRRTCPSPGASAGNAVPPDGYEILATRPLYLCGAVDGQEVSLQERDGQYWLTWQARGICGPVPPAALCSVLAEYAKDPATAETLRAAAAGMRGDSASAA